MQLAQQVNENSADNARMIKTIQVCSHCGIEVNKGNKFCGHCSVASDRKDMCLENKKLMPNTYHCKLCQV